MAGARNYLRIPPDSTGKRVRISHSIQVFYTNKTNGYLWKKDRTYSLSDGTKLTVNSSHETTTALGFIDCKLEFTAVNSDYSPTVGLGILDPDSLSVIATVDNAVDLYENTSIIVGKENPEYGVNVDSSGSMNVRFSEGIPQLDAFGKLRVSNATLLGSYTFHNDLGPQKWSHQRSHIGSDVVHNSTTVSADLVVDGTSGHNVAIVSDTYHHYFPGSSQLAMMTLAASHSNLSGNEIRWGMFDNIDGYGFMRSSDGQLKVFIRNSCDVDPDIEIPQSEWSGDKLDGSGDSSMNIDIGYDNLYWMDIQWLGAGRVRFGVYHNGQRVVCHEHNHDNTKPYPVCATGSLPLCFSNTNVGTTGFTSILKVFCAAVYTEAPFSDVTQYGRPDHNNVAATIPSSATINDTYIAGIFAPIENFAGRQNRTLYWPHNLNVSAFDTVTGNPSMHRIKIFAEPILSGLDFSLTHPRSSVVTSTTGTLHGPGKGREILNRVCHGNCDISLSHVWNNMSESAIRNYAANGGYINEAIASIANGGSTVEVTFNTGYIPFREAYAFCLREVEVNSSLSSINSASDTTFDRWVKITGENTAEIWGDAAFTVPLTLEGGSVTNTGLGHGYFGTQFYFVVTIQRIGPIANDIQVDIDLAWKELRQ